MNKLFIWNSLALITRSIIKCSNVLLSENKRRWIPHLDFCYFHFDVQAFITHSVSLFKVLVCLHCGVKIEERLIIIAEDLYNHGFLALLGFYKNIFFITVSVLLCKHTNRKTLCSNHFWSEKSTALCANTYWNMYFITDWIKNNIEIHLLCNIKWGEWEWGAELDFIIKNVIVSRFFRLWCYKLYWVLSLTLVKSARKKVKFNAFW